jgi:uncharacterized protein YbjT (DUF2867 family)
MIHSYSSLGASENIKHILVAGASGNLGRAVVREAVRRGFNVKAMVRSDRGAALVSHLGATPVFADATCPGSLTGICQNIDAVVSALGRSVSPSVRDKAGFDEIDFIANRTLVDEALLAGSKKFVYVSAFHSERYPHLSYFKTHHAAAEYVKASRMNYTIIKPVAFFSVFAELLEMAEKNRLVNIGKGDKRTNPISEHDVAMLCVDQLHQLPAEIEAGGPELFSRIGIMETIQRVANPHGRCRSVPSGLVKATLPVIRLIDRNRYDLFSFFLEVMEKDTIAPSVGKERFEPYLIEKKRLRHQN